MVCSRGLCMLFNNNRNQMFAFGAALPLPNVHIAQYYMWCIDCSLVLVCVSLQQKIKKGCRTFAPLLEFIQNKLDIIGCRHLFDCCGFYLMLLDYQILRAKQMLSSLSNLASLWGSFTVFSFSSVLGLVVWGWDLQTDRMFSFYQSYTAVFFFKQ